ncbi:IS3 family transposase [[Clostridium] scindens]|nr:IS3 family transposase [[Clostridium] scindens]
MTQSMSRVGKCIDNGPMEGFWGILKRERYYGKRFTDKETLVKMIEDYIDYYNNKRLQRNLGVLTPMEKHEIYLQKKPHEKLPADNLLAEKILYFFNCLLDGEHITNRQPLIFLY